MPVVCLTGNRKTSLAVQVMKAGALDFLTKPCSEAMLFNAVDNAIAHDRGNWTARSTALMLRLSYDSLSPPTMVFQQGTMKIQYWP